MPRRPRPERRLSGRLRIREVRAPDDPAIGAAHRLLRRIFPRSELLPLAAWRHSLIERSAGLWTDLAWHLVVAERGGRLVGAATANYVGNLNIGLIGYIGVARAGREHGLGGDLRERLREVLQRDALRMRGHELRALVGEVHVENPWLRHLVRYTGALPLAFPYRQPSIRSGEPQVRLVFYYQGLVRRRRSLRAEEVRRILYAIWRRVYRIDRPMAWPAFRAMVAALPPGARIGPVTLRPARSPRPSTSARTATRSGSRGGRAR